MNFLAQAAQLPGASPICIAIIALHRVGLTGKWDVTIPKAMWDQFGLSRTSVKAGIDQLETARLITTTRKPGSSTIVHIPKWAKTNGKS